MGFQRAPDAVVLEGKAGVALPLKLNGIFGSGKERGEDSDVFVFVPPTGTEYFPWVGSVRVSGDKAMKDRKDPALWSFKGSTASQALK